MAYKRQEIKSFRLFYDLWPQVRELTIEERGLFITAIFEYLIDGKDESFQNADRFLRGLWKSTREKLDSEKDDFYRRNDQQSKNRNGRSKDREPEDQEPP